MRAFLKAVSQPTHYLLVILKNYQKPMHRDENLIKNKSDIKFLNFMEFNMSNIMKKNENNISYLEYLTDSITK